MSEMPRLRKSNKDERKESAMWLLFNIVGSLLPLYVTALMLLVSTLTFDYQNFTRNGEFVLYAAALLAPAAFQILRDLRSPFPFRTGLGLGMLVLMIFAVALYVFANQQSRSEHTLSFAVVTVIIYVLSLIIAFWVNLIDMVRVSPDIRKIEESQLDDLRNEFRKNEGPK
jgi:cytochrome bd-type quinol oxidase subunit 2